jgi:hypothetical protein
MFQIFNWLLKYSFVAKCTFQTIFEIFCRKYFIEILVHSFMFFIVLQIGYPQSFFLYAQISITTIINCFIDLVLYPKIVALPQLLIMIVNIDNLHVQLIEFRKSQKDLRLKLWIVVIHTLWIFAITTFFKKMLLYFRLILIYFSILLNLTINFYFLSSLKFHCKNHWKFPFILTNLSHL